MPDLPAWVAIAASAVSGVAAVAGALGSQWINARYSLRTKRLELLYGRRATAYHTLLEAASNYALGPSEEGYRRYLAAAQNALILSSQKIADLLKSGELTVAIGRMRAAPSSTQADPVRATDFNEAMDKLSDAMQVDLSSLSEKR